jgi:hypothetical protein
MWVAWTSANVDGAGTPGLITWDTSCLAPAPQQGNLSGWVSVPGTNRKYVTFKGEGADEGHVEMFALGRTGPLLNIATDLYEDTIHQPPNDTPECGLFGSALAPGGSFQNKIATSLQFLEPNNVLKANGYLINGPTGQGFGFDPTMLANFFNPILIDDSIPALLGEFFTAPPDFSYPEDIGSPLIAALYDEAAPNLNYAWPRVSHVRVDTPFNLLNLVEEVLLGGDGLQVAGPTTVVDEWDRGIDAVSAVLTRKSVINEWAARETLSSTAVSFYETEWVVTFPTRYPPTENFYFPYVDDGVPAIAPFTDGATPIHTALWNREERSVTCVSGIGQGEACDPNNALPYETNVITFRAANRSPGFEANRLDSQVTTDIPQSIMPVPLIPGEWFGWMEMTFTGEKAEAGLGSDEGANQVYDDLPATDRTYNLGQSVFLRDGGGVFQEYCLFNVLTATGPGTAIGACPANDAQGICLADGTQVGDVNPFGVGTAQVIFEITDDTIAGVQPIGGAFPPPLPNTLLLTGAYAQPFLGDSEVEPETTTEPTCPVLTEDPPVAGANPLFTIPPGETTVVYRGMPVIGFATGVYNLGNPLVNYATATDHGYKRDVRLLDFVCPTNVDFVPFPPFTIWQCGD